MHLGRRKKCDLRPGSYSAGQGRLRDEPRKLDRDQGMHAFISHDKSLGLCSENNGQLSMGFKSGCDIRLPFYKDNSDCNRKESLEPGESGHTEITLEAVFSIHLIDTCLLKQRNP